MDTIKELLNTIIEQADCVKPACRNCASYKNGGCSYGCVNEKLKLTSANYSCDNFKANYEFGEDTIEALRDLKRDYERVDEGLKNLQLLLDGKIDEKDFVDIVG